MSLPGSVSLLVLCGLVGLVSTSHNRTSTYFDQFCNWTYTDMESEVSKRDDGRDFISAGTQVPIGSYQFSVAVYIPRGKEIDSEFGICTGSLLDDRHVLTAAHCALYPGVTSRRKDSMEDTDFLGSAKVKRILVILGTNQGFKPEATPNLIKAGAEAMYLHPDFDQGRDGNDIAVIRLNQSVPFNDDIRPVCLASRSDALSDDCVSLGFGFNEFGNNTNYMLNKAQTKLISNHECRTTYRQKIVDIALEAVFVNEPLHQAFDNYSYSREEEFLKEKAHWSLDDTLASGKLCAFADDYGQGVCAGDSGGPTLCATGEGKLKQFGITSTLLAPGNLFCPKPGQMMSFVSVRSHLTWLEFVVLPSLRNYPHSQKQEKSWFWECMTGEALKKIALKIKEDRGYPISRAMKKAICRKLVSQGACLLYSPDVEECNHIPAINFLPEFKNLYLGKYLQASVPKDGSVSQSTSTAAQPLFGPFFALLLQLL